MPVKITVMSLDFESTAPPMTRVYEQEEVSIGRFTENDLVLDGDEVSGRHAKLMLRNGGGAVPILYITDLGSSNGTSIESTPLTPNEDCAIAANERVIIGKYIIKAQYLAEGIARPRRPESVQQPEPEEPVDSLLDDDPDVIYLGAPPDEEQPASEPLEIESAEPEAKPAAEPEAAAADPPQAETAPSAPKSAFELTASENEVRAIAQNDVVLNFDAVRLYSISGRVTHNGNPLPGVNIQAGALGTRQTDQGGEYSFGDIVENSPYQLRPELEGYTFTELERAGTLTENTSANFEAKKLISVGGCVKYRDKPLEGVIIDGGPLGKTVTDAEGRYVFKDVVEGTKYTIAASKGGFKFNSGR